MLYYYFFTYWLDVVFLFQNMIIEEAEKTDDANGEKEEAEVTYSLVLFACSKYQTPLYINIHNCIQITTHSTSLIIVTITMCFFKSYTYCSTHSKHPPSALVFKGGYHVQVWPPKIDPKLEF